MNESLRLFTALRFNQNTIDEISKVQNQLIKIDPNARFVKPINNFHITLYFIGSIEKKKLKYIETSFKTACNIYKKEVNRSIKIEFNKLGEFKRSNGSIIWLGIKENDDMKTLANLIPDELEKNGFKVNKNKFTAHITLARKYKGKIPELVQLPENVEINQASLVWSHRNENNVLIYDNIVEYPITNNLTLE